MELGGHREIKAGDLGELSWREGGDMSHYGLGILLVDRPV